mgnify:CR=1 FL=1
MRPWFLSFTAIWNHATAGYEHLNRVATGFLDQIPHHQLSVKEKFWHFSVLPLVRIIEFPKVSTCEEYAFSILKKLVGQRDLLAIPSSPLCVEACEIVSYDSGTAVQFKGIENCLALLRDRLRASIKNDIDALLDGTVGISTELVPENPKNSGNKAFGSIARALTKEDNLIRWRQEFKQPILLSFETVYLLVSDEFLSNPYAHDDTYRIPIKL